MSAYRTPGEIERVPAMERSAVWMFEDIKLTWNEEGKQVHLSIGGTGQTLTCDIARMLGEQLQQAAEEAEYGR